MVTSSEGSLGDEEGSDGDGKDRRKLKEPEPGEGQSRRFKHC